MRILAILPVKKLRRAKTRLSTILSSDERTKLVLDLFLRTAKVCQRAGFKVLPLTSDDKVAEISVRMGWQVLEDEYDNLNMALAEAFKRFPHVPLLVVLPDLPLLDLSSLEMASRLGRRYGCVICPDLGLKGTNVLYVDDATCFRPMYGHASFSRHLNQLLRRYPVKVLVRPETALDIDTPEDLLFLSKLLLSSPTHDEESCYKY